MKLQRVYVDTSALGGCFDPEFAEWSNGLMQDFRNGLFKPLLSQVTATELQDAPEKVQAVYANCWCSAPRSLRRRKARWNWLMLSSRHEIAVTSAPREEECRVQHLFRDRSLPSAWYPDPQVL
jgi:hypothetical protein